MSSVSQKEYLKKYLGIGKAPGEKKKKKRKSLGNRLKIIDDDADVISQEIQEDISAANEDAPQIVAVIDERPPSMRIDEQTKSNLWKPIGATEDTIETKTVKLSTSFKLGKQIKTTIHNYAQSSSKSSFNEHVNKNGPTSSTIQIKEEVDVSLKTSNRGSISPPHRKTDDYSPSRRVKSERDVSPQTQNEYLPRRSNTPDNSPLRRRDDDNSPPRRNHREQILSSRKYDSDYSPPRKRGRDSSPPRKRHGGDNLPSRKNDRSGETSPCGKREDFRSVKNKRYISPQRQNNSMSSRRNTPNSSSRRDDNSPTRRSNNNPPPRRRDDDNSPRHKDDDSSPPRRKHNDDISSLRKHDFDSSPPRKRGKDQSPARRMYRDDSSPQRKTERDYSSFATKTDLSPPRRTNKKTDSSDMSPPRRRNLENNSPNRRNKEKSSKRKHTESRWGDWSPETRSTSPPKPDKMKTTLDGKKAGLQNARDLIEETTTLKRKEDEIFKNMSAEISGRNAATVVRAKKSDRDPEEVARQLEREKKTKEKYDRWGKGVKQMEDQNERIADQVHEMNKPLARYADDEDLERYLKEQEREGDPMLNYIRAKKKKKAVAAGVPEKPMYMGEFMPNRFGIRPGYRWDGVDRSNGYEKKWFQVQNAKRASQEDAFKWSTEDM